MGKKSKFLWITTYINIASAMTCGCMLDSESILPAVVLLINLLWLFLFGTANRWRWSQ